MSNNDEYYRSLDKDGSLKRIADKMANWAVEGMEERVQEKERERERKRLERNRRFDAYKENFASLEIERRSAYTVDKIQDIVWKYSSLAELLDEMGYTADHRKKSQLCKKYANEYALKLKTAKAKQRITKATKEVTELEVKGRNASSSYELRSIVDELKTLAKELQNLNLVENTKNIVEKCNEAVDAYTQKLKNAEFEEEQRRKAIRQRNNICLFLQVGLFIIFLYLHFGEVFIQWVG